MPILYQLVYTYKGLAAWTAVLILLIAVCMMAVRKQQPKSKSLLPVLYLGCLFLLLAVFLSYAGKYDASLWMNMLALAVISAFSVTDVLLRSKYDLVTVLQYGVVSAAILIWVGAAVYSDQTIHEYPSMIAIWLITAALLFVRWICSLLLSLCDVRIDDILSFAKENVLLLPIWLIITIVSLPILRYPYIWDSAVYFDTTAHSSSRWNFTTGTFPIFDAYAHKSFGYIALSQPGVWLFQDWTKGEHYVRFLLFVVTITLLWFLIKKWFPKIKSIERALLVLMISLSPAILAQSAGYNLDFGMTCFMVWILFAWAYDLDVFKVVFAFLFIFTKEPAVVLFGGFALGIYLIRFVCSNERLPRKLFTCMSVREWLSLGLAPVTWLIVFFLPRIFVNDNVAPWGDAPIGFVGIVDDLSGVLDQFGFSGKFFAIQFGHMFAMNFTWLLVAPVIVIVVILLRRKQSCSQIMPAEIGLPMIIALLFFYLFSSIFITHPHYRYASPAFVIVALVFVGAILAVIDKSAIRMGTYAVIACLFLAQCYFSIDPITNAMCTPMSTGKTKVYNYAKGYSPKEEQMISDYITYNLQGIQWGGLLSEVMEHIEQGENTLILVPKVKEDLTYSAFGGDIYQSGRGVFWDQAFGSYSTVETRNVICNHGGSLMIPSGEVVVNTDPEERPLSVYEHIYYLRLPYVEVDDVQLEDAIETAGYSIVEITDLSFGSWAMQIYRLL